MLIALLHLLALSAQAVAPPSLSAAPVLPDETKPSYRANGAPSCSAWREARKGKTEADLLRAGAYRRWVLGYVTGFNVAGPDQTGNLLGSASRDEFYAATDDYCGRHPKGVIADAMRPIITAIIGRRGIPAAGEAAAERKKSATVDAGTTCQEWTGDRNNSILRIAYVLTLSGYITAYNQWGPDPLGDAIGAEDQSLIEGTADRWCKEHPSGLLIGVAQPLMDHVAAERAAGRLPPAGMRPEDTFSGAAPIKR